MKNIGFVGLGVMGGPMASNLLGQGFRVTGQDLRREAVEQLVNQGGSAAERLENLAGCDAVIVMVNTDQQAREVIGELISLLRERPRPIISMATILPSTIRELGETANSAGIDAPLLQNSIRCLEQQGAEGLRSNLSAVIEALRTSSGGTA